MLWSPLWGKICSKQHKSLEPPGQVFTYFIGVTQNKALVFHNGCVPQTFEDQFKEGLTAIQDLVLLPSSFSLICCLSNSVNVLLRQYAAMWSSCGSAVEEIQTVVRNRIKVLARDLPKPSNHAIPPGQWICNEFVFEGERSDLFIVWQLEVPEIPRSRMCGKKSTNSVLYHFDMKFRLQLKSRWISGRVAEFWNSITLQWPPTFLLVNDLQE